MRFTLKVQMESAAFDGDEGLELARILRLLADRVEDHFASDFSPTAHSVVDANGNKCGTWLVSGDRE